LSDSFLFWLFLIRVDGSSRTSLPEAALDRIIQRLSQATIVTGDLSRGRSQCGAASDAKHHREPSPARAIGPRGKTKITKRDDDIRAADDAAKNPDAKNSD
jgi:hypothetical protein